MSGRGEAMGGTGVTVALTQWLGRLYRDKRALLPTAAAVVIFIAMLVYGEVAYGNILVSRSISNLLIDYSPLMLLAIGMTFVILKGGIDLSVGSVVAFTSVAGVMLVNAGWNPWLVMVLMVAMGAVFGLVAGVLVRYFTVQPFIATLATMFLARGLASMLSTEPQRLPADSPMRLVNHNWKIIDKQGIVNDFILTPGVLITLLVAAVAAFVLHRTRTGRTVYAIGGSEQSASLMGLPVGRTKVLVYVISGALAGLASVVYTSRLGAARSSTGLGWELDAIAATVIGGTLLTGGLGYVLGSVVGALVLGLLTALIGVDGTVDGTLVTIITGGILLVFVLLQRVVIGRKRE